MSNILERSKIYGMFLLYRNFCGKYKIYKNKDFVTKIKLPHESLKAKDFRCTSFINFPLRKR